MVKLYDQGVYLINGVEIAQSAEMSKEEAAKNTIAYRILKEHNQSTDMQH